MYREEVFERYEEQCNSDLKTFYISGRWVLSKSKFADL